jgi:hypothetical protein
VWWRNLIVYMRLLPPLPPPKVPAEAALSRRAAVQFIPLLVKTQIAIDNPVSEVRTGQVACPWGGDLFYRP